MGDVAIAVPVIKALREKYPEVKITVLTRPFFAPFFRGIRDMRFFHLNLKVKHKGLWGLFRLAWEAKKEGIDAVADMHDVIRSQIIRKLLGLRGCRVSHIDKGKSEKRRLCRRGFENYHQLRSSVERYADVLRDLGFDITPQPAPDMKLPVPLAIDYLYGKKTDYWIGIAPFAKHAAKMYPYEKMERVIIDIANKAQRVFLFGGGAEEKLLAEQLASQADNITSVIGNINLGEELNLMSNLDVILTMDSSAMHMASLVGTPTVSIWGGTHHYAGFLGFGQKVSDIVEIPLECRPCSVYGNKACRYGDYRCLRGITPEQVVERLWAVVERNESIMNRAR
jgi:ADP-heptose:LPS heptosyltransferase